VPADMNVWQRKDSAQASQAAKVFEDHAAEYDGWFTDSLVYRIERAALRSLNRGMPGPKMEIGVGPGRFAMDLGVVFGLDPARSPLQLARQRNITCCQGFGEELPIKDCVVGTVYLLCTLCFAFNPVKMVAESSRILHHGGYLVIGMVPARSPWGKHLAAKKDAGHIFYEHANFYTIEAVSQWLARANMRVVAHRSTLYQNPGETEYEEPPRDILDEGAGFVVMAARRGHV
jgi:SAM-dependent methyltransferase